MSEIRVNTFKAEDGISAPSFPNGIQVTGVITATVLDSTVPFLNAGSNIQLGNAGVVTATTFKGNGDFVELDVDGHTNLDNVNVAGVATFASAVNTGALTASTGTFSGNVSVGGTLTYEDVSNIDSVGIVTAREGIFIPDSKEIKLGNTAGSPDMKIHHDGNHSIIEETGTGNLFLKTTGSEIAFLGDGGSDYMVRGIQNGATELYYNASKKFESTNTGAVVTGIMTATSFSDSKGDVRKIPANSKSSAYTLLATDSGKAIYISSGGVTVPNSVFSGNEAVTIINNSASNQTITQGSGMTLYFTSDGTSGNRTLGARGMATIWFSSSGQSFISGSGLT
tara:strand:+ start:613 stop:1626 length:1014 start_codon:yes stop_codon:yes gene_type:complete